jgi:hypothetical protein
MKREPQRRMMFETRCKRTCDVVLPLENTEIGFGTIDIREAERPVWQRSLVDVLRGNPQQILCSHLASFICHGHKSQPQHFLMN